MTRLAAMAANPCTRGGELAKIRVGQPFAVSTGIWILTLNRSSTKTFYPFEKRDTFGSHRGQFNAIAPPVAAFSLNRLITPASGLRREAATAGMARAAPVTKIHVLAGVSLATALTIAWLPESHASGYANQNTGRQ